MKKLVVAGLFAISVLAISEQQASAWINSRFGVGLNWDWQSGGNNFLWGAWRNGQPPGPEAFNSGAYQARYQGPVPGLYGQGPQGYAPPMAQPYMGSPAFMPPAPQAFPGPQGFAPMPQGFFDAGSMEQPFAAPYGSPYQFANYPRPAYYYPQSYYYYGR
jgi:hypothetical protein